MIISLTTKGMHISHGKSKNKSKYIHNNPATIKKDHVIRKARK